MQAVPLFWQVQVIVYIDWRLAVGEMWMSCAHKQNGRRFIPFELVRSRVEMSILRLRKIPSWAAGRRCAIFAIQSHFELDPSAGGNNRAIYDVRADAARGSGFRGSTQIQGDATREIRG